MRLTRSADYILRILYCLAQHDPGEIVKRQDIVAAGEIPDSLFPKLAAQLRRAGLIEISQGARGGYRLALPPEEITLLQAIEAGLGEDAVLNECVSRPSSCRRSPTCAVHAALDEASQHMRESLRQVTLAELVRREACLTESGGRPD